MSADEKGVELVAQLEAAVAQRNEAEATIIETLVAARALRPPVPLAVLAKTMGVTESAISVRLSRMSKSKA